MPKLANRTDCTGCAACSNACPHSAISMSPLGNLQHVSPFINHDLCVECGSCSRSCPVLSPQTLNASDKAIAAWAKDSEENKKSTSGGVATIASRYILEHGGCVYGCTSDGADIHHIRVDRIADIEKLRGSKYVQSSIGKSFSDAKKDLRNGLDVLFIGTPCQIAGLRAFLKKEYSNLYTMDIICHGASPLKMLQNHIKKYSALDDISRISFRENGFFLRIYDKKGKEILSKNIFDPVFCDSYYGAFFEGFSYRESCYHCRYAQPKRCSDITVGDYWGLGKKIPFDCNVKSYGYSVVLCNTLKGKNLIGRLSDSLYMYDRPLEEAVEGNAQLHSPKKKDFRTKIFRWLINFGGLDFSFYMSVLDKWILHRMFDRIRK